MSLPRPGLAVYLIIFLSGTPAASPLPPAAAAGAQRAVRRCREGLEYLNGNLCCLNCPAGERVSSHCTAEGRQGDCVECDHGTYLQHSNGLEHCLRCTQCRPDQDVVVPCAATHDTQCECKAGKFCSPDEACEVCRKCSSCGKDEVLVRNCTPTSNSECKKAPLPESDSPSTGTKVIIAIISSITIVVILSIALLVCWLRRRTVSVRSQVADQLPFGDGHAAVHGPLLVRSKPRACSVSEENKTLCESLSSSASNSQHSLSAYYFSPQPRGASPLTLPPPATREEEPFPLLLAVNGEESLRKCFDFFVHLDLKYHSRFFRKLSLSDNLIKSKESLPYEDKMHELLGVWMEKTGREASINHLLKALLELDQRRTAEEIKEMAVKSNHYRLDES